jgi:hypothetical protein
MTAPAISEHALMLGATSTGCRRHSDSTSSRMSSSGVISATHLRYQSMAEREGVLYGCVAYVPAAVVSTQNTQCHL